MTWLRVALYPREAHLVEDGAAGPACGRRLVNGVPSEPDVPHCRACSFIASGRLERVLRAAQWPVPLRELALDCGVRKDVVEHRLRELVAQGVVALDASARPYRYTWRRAA